ncbi:hypothetical protein IM267_21115, partial [Enterobacter cloacae complex sp. P15RS]|uniref:hypothetical protein n=1 Tax=Enterobacter cloacae complex sp. P15RS TaxID=2779578 RepID=UPI001865DFF2
VLTVPPEVKGNEGERIALPLTIDAKTAVTRLDWEAPEFVAHGGKVTVEKDKVWLELPAWSDSGSNQPLPQVTTKTTVPRRIQTPFLSHQRQ